MFVAKERRRVLKQRMQLAKEGDGEGAVTEVKHGGQVITSFAGGPGFAPRACTRPPFEDFWTSNGAGS